VDGPAESPRLILRVGRYRIGKTRAGSYELSTGATGYARLTLRRAVLLMALLSYRRARSLWLNRRIFCYIRHRKEL
jgi:hypothetical protein